MKRTAVLIATLAITLLASATLVMAQNPNPSVPNLIDFQGKLTTPAGNPVANGVHTLTFRIYDTPVAGSLLWSEGPLGITTTGGLFTQQLGSSNPLPEGLFEDNDELWLEVEADGAIITPRTRLISNPYTRVANSLECKSPFNDSTYLESWDGGHGIRTFGSDGKDQVWLYGYSWGELFLYDSSPANTIRATLSAGGTNGYLNLSGTSPISLNTGTTGDATAILPTDAINSGEILDEPGVSNNDASPVFFSFGAGNADYTVDSVDIAAPAAGYIEVSASSYINTNHTTGTTTQLWITVDPTKTIFGGGVFIPNGSAVIGIPSTEASGNFQVPYSTSRLFVVGSASTYRYYLIVRKASGAGTPNIVYHYVRAIYYPTLYGTVTLAKQPGGLNRGLTQVSTDGSQMPPNVEMTTITAADHNTRLEAEHAKQMAEMEARIKKLEQVTKAGTPQVIDDNR